MMDLLVQTQSFMATKLGASQTHEPRDFLRLHQVERQDLHGLAQVIAVSGIFCSRHFAYECVESCRDYVQAIVAHSRRYTANSLYPGQNYLKLAAWLQQETHHKSILDVKYTSAVLHCFAADGPPEILRYRHQDLETFTNQIRLEHRINRILFLRGYTSPDWISTIGSVFRIDPEFFNRHLAFMTTLVSRSAFSTPSLSSSCRNIITLRINTILVQNGISLRKEFKNLAARRRSEAAGLNAYSRLYQTTAHYGDSIVRDFCTLDDHYSVLEQEISVCVRKSKGNWLGLYRTRRVGVLS